MVNGVASSRRLTASNFGWELNWPKRKRLVHTVNKADQAIRCGAEFDFLFIDYRQRGFHAAYLGRKTVLGTEAEAVQIDQQGCSSAVYFFDPKTFHLLMTELTISTDPCPRRFHSHRRGVQGIQSGERRAHSLTLRRGQPEDRRRDRRWRVDFHRSQHAARPGNFRRACHTSRRHHRSRAGHAGEGQYHLTARDVGDLCTVSCLPATAVQPTSSTT